jgi:hypothetical protein
MCIFLNLAVLYDLDVHLLQVKINLAVSDLSILCRNDAESPSVEQHTS